MFTENQICGRPATSHKEDKGHVARKWNLERSNHIDITETVKDKIYIYDFEVFRFDWLVVIEKLDGTETTVIHNDPYRLLTWTRDHYKSILMGFNSNRYDKFIYQAIMTDGVTNAQVKSVNDWIIGGNTPWDHPFLKSSFVTIPLFFSDLMNDIPLGSSLKKIEGYMGLPIIESSVPFDIERPLTEEELEETIFYCTHDVKATKALAELRADYLDNKIHLAEKLGNETNITPEAALTFSNANLVSRILNANPGLSKSDDERDFTYPDWLKDNEKIPPEVLEFFNKTYDQSIPSDLYYDMKANINIGEGVIPTYGFGGIHYAKENYIYECT